MRSDPGGGRPDGRLVRPFTDNHVFEVIPLSAVYSRGRRRMPTVRAFLDFFDGAVRARTWATPVRRNLYRSGLIVFGISLSRGRSAVNQR